MKIGASIEKAHGGAAIAPTQSSYNELHTRVDRLLVAVGGGLLWSTFIVRSFSARRPSLTQHSAQYWYELTEKPLARERWSSHFAWIAAVSVLLAYGLGYFVRGFGVPVNARGAKITTVGGQNNGVMLLDSSDVALRHIVRFDEEGSCVASPDARIWPGAALSTSNRAHIASIARALAACSTQQNPVRVEVVGFASSSEFRTVANCGKETTSEQANVALANARASNVKASLERNLERNTIALRVWKNDEAMRREREIVDRLDGGTYVGDRGWLNRRVEIRVIDSGACDPNK